MPPMTPDSVSYTHLDVYKRQATRSERGRVYAVTSEQLQLLLDSLQAQLDKLQPGQGGPRH